MKQRKPVSHIMTKNVISVDMHNGTLTEAKNIMEQNNVRHVPVTGGGKLAGILSLTDIYRISYGGNFGQDKPVDNSIFNMLSIGQVMRHNPVTVQSKTPIKEVAERLAVEEFHALPVVSDNGSLEGIVTTTDLVKFLINQY